MVESDEQQALRIARSIVDGSLPLLLGCRKILGPLRRLGLDDEKPLIKFVGIDSETDHLPLDPEDRKLWNPQALVEKDKEIEKYSAWAKPLAFEACEVLIRRLESIWIFLENLAAFVTFISNKSGYDLIPDEVQAIIHGVHASDAEAGRWYEYDFAGEQTVHLLLATDPGSSVLWWRLEGPPSLREAINVAAEIMQRYRLV
jgi:hypothetical protein